MGRPPSKLITIPDGRRGRREDYFTRSEIVALEESWLHENPGAGKQAFYRWYAENYFGLPPDKIGDPELERARQLFRDAKERAREAGWLKD
jgi:hypothetical protein